MKKRSRLRAMKKRQRMIMLAVVAWTVFGAVTALAILSWTAEEDTGVTVQVTPAALSDVAVEGEAVFNANCAECHGPNGAGTNLGPPLIHDIYNPGHHSDQAFYLAAANGVRAHHWPYGDMPAQSQVSREEVTLVIRYIRELQEANGILAKSY
ncbi:MAG: c-type cytochrome [Chloroflexi bacterium]|nr:c-type cytochrome [Chloroflexota bacterium]